MSRFHLMPALKIRTFHQDHKLLLVWRCESTISKLVEVSIVALKRSGEKHFDNWNSLGTFIKRSRSPLSRTKLIQRIQSSVQLSKTMADPWGQLNDFPSSLKQTFTTARGVTWQSTNHHRSFTHHFYVFNRTSNVNELFFFQKSSTWLWRMFGICFKSKQNPTKNFHPISSLPVWANPWTGRVSQFLSALSGCTCFSSDLCLHDLSQRCIICTCFGASRQQNAQFLEPNQDTSGSEELLSKTSHRTRASWSSQLHLTDEIEDMNKLACSINSGEPILIPLSLRPPWFSM